MSVGTAVISSRISFIPRKPPIPLISLIPFLSQIRHSYSPQSSVLSRQFQKHRLSPGSSPLIHSNVHRILRGPRPKQSRSATSDAICHHPLSPLFPLYPPYPKFHLVKHFQSRCKSLPMIGKKLCRYHCLYCILSQLTRFNLSMMFPYIETNCNFALIKPP